jgi:serine/threonine-protein kinase ULK/ATG1
VYAVKCIDKNKIQGTKDLHNLQNEIAIMAEIRSPHVVALRDATKTQSNYYLAMELCNGGDLDGFRKARGGFLQEQEARLILRQIMKGIQAIKEKNVMHRDLKLPNVMINFAELAPNICTKGEFVLKDYIAHFDFKTQHQTLTCKIADLGFARKLDEDQLAKTGCGTPLLMAPEVLSGQLYNHKADVWSLGCLFYELLTGFMPFTGISHQNLRDNLKKGVFKIPKSVKISLQGVSFLQACLQYETSKRISWQDIVSHPYIASEDFEGHLDLTLSYIGGHN